MPALYLCCRSILVLTMLSAAGVSSSSYIPEKYPVEVSLSLLKNLVHYFTNRSEIAAIVGVCFLKQQEAHALN